MVVVVWWCGGGVKTGADDSTPSMHNTGLAHVFVTTLLVLLTKAWQESQCSCLIACLTDSYIHTHTLIG